MSLTRRLELLETARQRDAWVLEDDYDSEYRYTGTPIPSLQGLDADGRVIYMGTFSKVLFPSVRLGYIVAPSSLADAMARARALIDRGSESITQAVIERFMREGHFGRHIRRMRSLYAARQAVLVESAQQMLGGLLYVQPSDAGMSLLAKLPPGVDDATASRRIAQNGVDAQPLSAYCVEQPRESGLVLGYSGVTEDGIRDGVRRIRAALRLRETA
jgi:GntR family transcriptional regulator/MocR family aminotransferase